METLNYPNFAFKIKEKEGKNLIFDPVRKKFVSLTPEEWVRQHVLQYLIQEKKYPPGLIAVETAIQFQGMLRRCDVVVYQEGTPFILVECKAPQVQMNQQTIAQIARYQSVLKVPYMHITNGHFHLSLHFDDQEKLEVINEIPTCKVPNFNK